MEMVGSLPLIKIKMMDNILLLVVFFGLQELTKVHKSLIPHARILLVIFLKEWESAKFMISRSSILL